MNVLDVCNNYFKGFNDITSSENTTRVLGVLKIASYFTVILPLIFGTIYGLTSLCGRATLAQELPKKLKATSTKISFADLIEPTGTLTPIIREGRIRTGAARIAAKLQKEFDLAQLPQCWEDHKQLVYHSAPQTFVTKYAISGFYPEESTPAAVISARVGDHSVGICSAKGHRPTLEDTHLATSFSLNLESTTYPVELFGIFDGHGGPEASSYMKENLQRELNETLIKHCSKGLTDENIWNALKLTFVILNAKFKHPIAGTTATVVMILNGKLWTANVGDSRTILDTGIQLSEDAKPAKLRYKNGIENRGGTVIDDGIHGRIDGTDIGPNQALATARAVGDHHYGIRVSARPKITCIPLPEQGTHLILTCDGIYDVATTKQVAESVRMHRELSADQIAKDLVYSAYIADSQDNLSAMVVKL